MTRRFIFATDDAVETIRKLDEYQDTDPEIITKALDVFLERTVERMLADPESNVELRQLAAS